MIVNHLLNRCYRRHSVYRGLVMLGVKGKGSDILYTSVEMAVFLVGVCLARFDVLSGEDGRFAIVRHAVSR